MMGCIGGTNVLDKKIGEGRTAEIFALDDHRIAKVFRSHVPDHFIDRELKISETVQGLGIKVPKVYGIEIINEKNAIIYEKVDGNTLISTLAKKPWHAKEVGQKMARLHYEVHSKNGEGLDSYKDFLKRHIAQVDELTEEEKAKIVAYLATLPDGTQLCHGDFHPDNILISPKGSVVIDWTTAVTGNPLADVARTAMILKDAALPEQMPKLVKKMFQRLRTILHKNYLDTYIELSKSQREDITKWELPIMAARLIEDVPREEKNVLCSKIREQIHQ
jgi:aminoglycoside phosphotransferase (APT) family kinase protein